MKFSTASLILALSAAPLFVHGTNHHSLTCAVWPEACDDDHDSEEERRTLLDAQFDAVRAAGHGAKRPTRKLSKNGPPLPTRPVFCDEFKMYWNTTEYAESIVIQGSGPAQRGNKMCLNTNTDPPSVCRGDTSQNYFNLYTDPALTKYGGKWAENQIIVNQIIVQTDPVLRRPLILQTGSIEVNTTDFGGEILVSNLFGERYEITAGSKSYLGATGTIAVNTKPFEDELINDASEFIIRCELTNPSNQP